MKRPNQYLVVSCGSSRLVAAHLRMNAAGRCDLVDHCIVEVGFDTNDPLLWLKAASHRFGELRRKFGNDAPTGFVLPGHLTLSKYLKIPQVPAKKRARIVAYEARQNIPYPMGEVTWSDFPVGEDDQDFEVAIGAARTELVEALTRYGEESKLGCDRIEAAHICLLNGFRYNYSDLGGCAALVSVGAKSTDLIYYDAGKFYSRNLAFGGNAVTQAISDTLGLPFSDAERLKLDAAGGEPLPSIEYAAFADASEMFAKRLSVEINRTTAIYKRQGGDRVPSTCYLAGGGSNLSGLNGKLSRLIDTPVETYDPLRKVVGPDAPDADKPFLGEAIGMALGRFLPESPELNLLPRSVVWQRKFRRQQPYYIVAGLVASAAVALPLVNTMIAVRAYEQELKNIEAQIEPLSHLNRRIFDRTESIKQLQSVIEQSSQLAQSRSNWVRFFNDIQTRLMAVEDVWLDRLDVARPESASAPSKSKLVRAADPGKPDTTAIRLRLEGRLLDVKNPLSSVSQDSNLRVKALLESLERSKFVSALESESFDNTLPGVLKFSFTLVVDPALPL